VNYLGYNINIRGRVWRGDMVEADIAGQDGEHISIADTDSISAEASAREIVDYAKHHRATLTDSAWQVLY
jgi:hypothetical protein